MYDRLMLYFRLARLTPYFSAYYTWYWADSVLRWFPQTAPTLRLVPLFQETGQGREKFLLQVVHAAPIELMGLDVLADGQALHEPLLEIILVLGQYSFRGVVQKLQILFQLGEVAFG